MNDCLIIHTPKFQNWYRSLGNYTSTQLMTLGIFGLADAVRQRGFTVRILHLGLEKALDPSFTLAGWLARNPARVVAFSVHFHQQLYDSLRAATAVKSSHPDVFVVLGGMTASFFAREILASFPAVDAIVQGEGERALPDLIAALRSGAGDYSKVPNLWRRQGPEPVRNEAFYLAERADLDALDFCALELMEHHEHYVRMPKIFSRLKVPPGIKWWLSQFLTQRRRRIFYALAVGRGCVTNCAYCGGGVSAQRLVNRRPRAIFRSPEKVVESVRKLKDFGYDGAYISFDPLPESDAYYRALFPMIKREGIAFDLPFAAWGLPSREFIDAYGETFTSESYLLLSPETGSERIRGVTRGYRFGNEELLATIRHAEERGVTTHNYFSLGIPGETKEDFEETLRLTDRIRREFKRARIFAFSVEIEPASPWHLDPDKYGIHLTRRTLEDFLADQKSPTYSSMFNLGYYPDTYLGEAVADARDFADKLLAVKCRHFCDQRTLCNLAAPVWRSAGFLGLDTCGDVAL